MNYRHVALLACLIGAQAQTREHAETTIRLRLPAAPAVALPLFGPIRESEWSPHWNPRMLFPAGKEQMAGAVFTTQHGDGEAVWIMTAYDEPGLRITYAIVWPGMCAAKLDIVLTANADQTTEAVVTYRQTALSEAGDRYVKDFASDFPKQREHWEQAIGYRLIELRKKP
jgi:hypothetical protein